MGRPSSYREEYAEQAKKLCEQFGAIDGDLSVFFGVSTRTINTWKLKHPKFRKALAVGKDAADDRVEKALYDRCVGYTFTEEKVFQHQGVIVRAEVETHIAPDPKACMYWLGNRRRDRWSFRPDGDPKGDEPTPERIPVEVVDASDSEAD